MEEEEEKRLESLFEADLEVSIPAAQQTMPQSAHDCPVFRPREEQHSLGFLLGARLEVGS